MKRIVSFLLIAVPMSILAQTAVDAYSVSQTDLKGTARYMSMAGAFTALGGDMTAINQNPGGIGVYRSSDIGLTLNLDLQSTKSAGNGITSKISQTKFTCNNFGYVGSYKLDSETMPYVNWGFSYNRPVSYNRRYGGKIADIKSSLSNYTASITNTLGYTSYDLAFEYDNNDEVLYDPYYDSYAPWMSIMAYNSYLINPMHYDTDGIGSEFVGLMNPNTYGFSEYEIIEEGGIDEFNINLGGNLANMLYWGVAFGINNLEFNKYTYYGEGLNSASVIKNEEGAIDSEGIAAFGLENRLSTTGSGMNFKFGVIFKPVNEFRIGMAFHTPTYWTLKDEILSQMNYETISSNNFTKTGIEKANAGYLDVVEYKVRTPWKFNMGLATVIGTKAILSFDYERVAYNEMNIEYDDGYGYFSGDKLVTQSIKDYYKAMNIFKIGGEYRLTPSVCLRLGYAYQSSPVNEDAINGRMEIMTAGTTPAYTFDKSTQYITGGLGYRYKGFYTDLAYVNKSRKSVYSAFSPYNEGGSVKDLIQSPKAIVKDNNSQLVWSIGYRF